MSLRPLLLVLVAAAASLAAHAGAQAHPRVHIVATGGTIASTNYYSAQPGHITVADARPVVVTGAMRPADGIGVDGPANLYNAVRLASDPAARGRGTMLILNDEILAARDATKSNAVRPNAFSAPYRGDLGVADP